MQTYCTECRLIIVNDDIYYIWDSETNQKNPYCLTCYSIRSLSLPVILRKNPKLIKRERSRFLKRIFTKWR